MGRSAVVTGATGFIGSHLAAALVAGGWEVAAVVRPTSGPMPVGTRRLVHDGSTEGLSLLMRDARPEVVFHLASLFVAEHTQAQVEPLIKSNVLFGAQLLEAMDSADCRVLVDAATSWQHFEDAPYDPVCLYAATKQAFSDIATFYVNARGFRRIALEMFDTYGSDDARSKLFTALLGALESEPLQMSPGDQLIDLVHVDDVVRAFEVAAERCARLEPGSAEAFAVGADERVSLRDLVEAWRAAMGLEAAPVCWGERPYRSREVMVPPTVTPRLPGWAPTVGVDEGLRLMAQA